MDPATIKLLLFDMDGVFLVARLTVQPDRVLDEADDLAKLLGGSSA